MQLYGRLCWCEQWWTAEWEFDHSLLISPLFLNFSLGFCQFSSIRVHLLRAVCRLCVPVCVCGPRRCLIIPGLCRGLSLGLPLPTVKFPLLTAWTMQTLPRLSATSASSLAAIYRPQPQVYLCLRHPIISSWCLPEKGPMVQQPGKLWQLSIQPHPNFLFQWQTVRKLARQTINQAGIGGFKVQVGIWLV